MSQSLIASLAPCIDQLRDVATQLGARPYQVLLVWTRWAGGERGVGVEEIIRTEALLPTPKIADVAGLSRALQPIGIDEVGSVTVTEISTRYTEDFLLGLGVGGTPIPEDQNFFWEVHYPRPDGGGVRRRFTPKSAPSYSATRFQWSITLLRASEDRTRAGMLR
jgi:hypothetical protein